MDSYPRLKPGQAILAIVLGSLLVLGSLAHRAWAAPGQDAQRQSVPTSPYTPTPTSRPRQEQPAATATPLPEPTATTAASLPETGGSSAATGAALDLAALFLLGGGAALLIAGISLKARGRDPTRARGDLGENTQ